MRGSRLGGENGHFLADHNAGFLVVGRHDVGRGQDVHLALGGQKIDERPQFIGGVQGHKGQTPGGGKGRRGAALHIHTGEGGGGGGDGASSSQ